MKLTSFIRGIIGTAVLATACSTASANTIKVGMSAALTGPASALGNGVKTGIESYFAHINANGGINGNTLELIALDDGYEPDRAAPNMATL